MAIKLATHFPTLVGNAIYFTQKSLTGLSGGDLNKVNKLIFSHYPFTSDLEHIGSITYRLTDGYYTVRYPSTAKELHMFNMSYALYTQIEGNFYFTKSMPTDCLLAPVASQVSDELRNMKLPTYDELETLMNDPSAYVPSDPRYAGVLRSPDPDDLTECNYYLLPVMYGSIKLSELDLGMGYRVVRSKCFNTPPTICIAILEMYRLAQLLHLEDPVDYKYVLDEWYEVPRYPGYDHGMLCPINDDTTLRAPFDPRECALLATHPERRETIVLVKRDAGNDLDGSKYGRTVLTSICRDLTTKSTLVQAESSLIQGNLPITSGLTLTATDNHQNSFIRNKTQEQESMNKDIIVTMASNLITNVIHGHTVDAQEWLSKIRTKYASMNDPKELAEIPQFVSAEVDGKHHCIVLPTTEEEVDWWMATEGMWVQVFDKLPEREEIVKASVLGHIRSKDEIKPVLMKLIDVFCNPDRKYPHVGSYDNGSVIIHYSILTGSTLNFTKLDHSQFPFENFRSTFLDVEPSIPAVRVVNGEELVYSKPELDAMINETAEVSQESPSALDEVSDLITQSIKEHAEETLGERITMATTQDGKYAVELFKEFNSKAEAKAFMTKVLDLM